MRAPTAQPGLFSPFRLVSSALGSMSSRLTAGSSGLQSLGTEGLTKSIFSRGPSEYLILSHWLRFDHMPISEPITQITVMRYPRTGIGNNPRDWKWKEK